MGVARRPIQLVPQIAVYLALIAAGVIMIMPLVWLILSSLKVSGEITTRPIVWFPKVPQWSNYAEAWRSLNFGRLFFNSTLVTLLTSLGVLATSSLTGYGLAKLKFPGRDQLFYLIISLMMVPFFMLMVPTYVIIKQFGWINSFAGVIVPEMTTPFGIFLMRQFMLSIPDDLLDAARIDGAGEWRIFWQIALPLCRSSLSALGIFALIYHWDNFLWPLLVLSHPEKMTIPIGLNRLWNPNSFPEYNLFMAGATLAVLPIVIVFLFAQRRFIEGIAMTGIKG